MKKTYRQQDAVRAGMDFIPLDIDTSPEYIQQVTREYLERTLAKEEVLTQADKRFVFIG